MFGQNAWTDTPAYNASAAILQRTLKEYIKGKHTLLREGEKIDSIKRMTMSTQTEDIIPLSSSVAPVMGPWTDSHPMLRVLLIFSNPSNTHPLRLQAEEKCIRDALRGGKYGERVVVDVLPACTIDDLARQLMSHSYEIIHFSGHADRSSALVKHTMGVLVGEHNVEFTNFKDADVLKKLETAAEEVVQQLELKLMQAGCCHSPHHDEIKISCGDPTQNGKSCSYHLQQSIIMHGKLYGEKITHSTAPCHLIARLSQPTTPLPPSPATNGMPSSEPKSPDRACRPRRSEEAFQAAHEYISTLSIDHQELAILNISKLQVRLKQPCCTPASAGPSVSTPIDASSPGSSDGGDSPVFSGVNGEAYGEVNLVKQFSLRDLLEIGVGSLAFEGEHGHMAHVSPYTFAALLANHCPPLQCVILNACGGHIQGEILATVVPQTVCFSGRISDKESLIFSRGFYDSIAQGHPVNKAFRDGSSRMELHALSPGVPQRKEQVYGGGVLPLVTLLKNDKLYRALHDSCVEIVSQAILEKDAKLVADNACLLEENNKLRSLITYGMELLQNKDKDLEAMRRALTMLAASNGKDNGFRKGGGTGVRIKHTMYGSDGVGNIGLLGYNMSGGNSSSVPQRKRNSGSRGSSSSLSSGEGGRPVRWKHVSTGAMGTKSTTSVAGDVDAALPHSRTKKPKWYKDIQSSGYGKVSFRNRKSVGDSSTTGSGSRHTSPNLHPPQHHLPPAPPSLKAFPGQPSSPVQTHGQKAKKIRDPVIATNSPMRPISAGKRNQQRDRGVAEQSGLVLDMDGDVWNIFPPERTPVSSSEHIFSSTLIITNSDGGEDQLLVDLAGTSPPPIPSLSTFQHQQSAQGSTQGLSVSRKKATLVDAEGISSVATGTPPRSSLTRSKSSAPGRYNQRSLQRSQQQHVISKSTAWAKEYPAGDPSTNTSSYGSTDISSTPSFESAVQASGSVDSPAAAASTTRTQETVEVLGKPSGYEAIQQQKGNKRISSVLPVYSSRKQQQSKSLSVETTLNSLPNSLDAETAPRKSQTSKSTSGNFREKSAGFRQFLKEMRSGQNAQKPTSSFASSVRRFQNSSSVADSGGVGNSTGGGRDTKH